MHRETAAEENEAVYFKILDRIAEGYFHSATTDKELYDKFLRLLKDDALITDLESLSSFQLALSIHNSAPRIEAHYQYYNTAIEPLLQKSGAKACDTWLEFASKQFCSPQFEKEDAVIQGLPKEGSPLLPFDRQSGMERAFGKERALPATIYADITSPEFGRFHPLIKKAAENGKVSYRIRHKPSAAKSGALKMSGFGAELALKRTDYIVIDDRNAGDKKKEEKSAEDLDSDEEVADLTPLSSSELEDLSMKAASYVMGSEYPLKRLLKVTQDFPKYSSFLAGQEVSQPFKKEHLGNRELLLPAGYNVLWINGVQYDPRKVDAYSLIEHLRRERNLVASFRELGFSNAEAIQLLTHPANADAQQSVEAMRYDWRDENEGGNVIIWLNDIAKDKRYEEWPADLMSYLGRTYPGQLPMVRRDLHTLIIPVDFSDIRSVTPVVETVQDFVKRKVPVRFGIVPLGHSDAAGQQGKVAYHILETYGIGALLEYLEKGVASKKLTAPQESHLTAAVEKRKVKTGFEARSLQQVLEADDSAERIKSADRYLTRLGARLESPPLFINGVPIKNDDNWLQSFSQQISLDMRNIQKLIWDGSIVDEETWLPGEFLKDASLRRNPLIIPENEKEIEIFNLLKVYGEEKAIKALENAPVIPAAEGTTGEAKSQLVVVGDFNTDEGLKFLLDALTYRQKQQNLELLLVHQNSGSGRPARSFALLEFLEQVPTWTEDAVKTLTEQIENLLAIRPEEIKVKSSSNFWATTHLVAAFGLQPGERALILNGRKVGPIPAGDDFSQEDFETLYGYEVKKRVLPAMTAIEDLGYGEKIKTAMDSAKLVSMLALSSASDMPEGIFELPPPIRTRLFYSWNTTHTSFDVGNNSTAAIQIVAVIDPASEVAQQWTPILKVLSELDGLFLRLFLNPASMLQQLPVKRFYRYALEAKPTFDENGTAVSAGVKFEGIPKDALLTAGLNVPPAWLVAPKDSIHDLDNIKLSSLPAGTNLDATYELENILIEGHSRDVTTGIAPRGAQLALSTAKDPRFADTLIMANLGYFQFKANPGFYNISLLPGASESIFSIDSVGALGYEAQKGDESTEVTLMSFSGVTLYPRLSRKPGMEEEDVLGAPKSGAAEAAAGLASKGASVVDGLLAKVGIKKAQTGKVRPRSAGWRTFLALLKATD